MAQSDTDLVVSRDALGMADLGVKPQTLATQGTTEPPVSCAASLSTASLLTRMHGVSPVLCSALSFPIRSLWLHRILASRSQGCGLCLAGPPILLRHRGQRGPQVQGHIDRASHPNQPQRV